MKRPIIIWLICTILLTLCVIISGCKTGGTTLSTGNLQKGSDGIWRLKKAPPVAPIEPKTVVEEPQKPIIITNKVEDVKLPPAPLKPVKSRPTIELNSAEATNENLPPVKGAGEITPFEPSVSETPVTLPKEKSPANEELSTKPLKSDAKVSVSNEVPKEGNYIKIHWGVLLLGLIMFVWIVYDIIRDFIKDRREIAASKIKPVKKRIPRRKSEKRKK